MDLITIELPWLLLFVLAICAVVGAGFLIKKAVFFLTMFWTLQKRMVEETEKEAQKVQFVSTADQKAQALIDQKIKQAWRSFSPVQWTKLDVIRDECLGLVRDIAAVYYPSSQKPELEITLSEILRLHEHVTQKVQAIVTTLPSLNRFSIASLLEAKSIFEQTRTVFTNKKFQTGGRIASRVWQAVNMVDPRYWLNKALFHGASEVVGRKVMTSIFRIVGTEAMKVYRSSSAVRFDPGTVPPADEIAEEKEEEPKQQEDQKGEPPPEQAEPAHGEEPPPAKTDRPEEESRELAVSESPLKPLSDEMEDESTRKSRLVNAIAGVLSRFIEGSMQLWEKLVDPESILNKYRKKHNNITALEDVRTIDRAELDAMAKHYINSGTWMSAAEGAATGAGGVFLIAADAVSLLALQLRTIQQIGYCYGFDARQPEERLFAVKLLAEAYQHPAMAERSALMQEMRFATNVIKGKAPLFFMKTQLFQAGMAKVAQKIGIRMGGRKVAQFVPILGAVAGGFINQKVTRDIAKIAMEVYRERFKGTP
ncbi:hypothetical protein GF373_00005 [bacterium]|nr:hypothetical protein [bacterium]